MRALGGAVRWLAPVLMCATLIAPVSARADGCQVTEFPGTSDAARTPTAHGLIEAMPDGNMWFGEGNSVARIEVHAPNTITKFGIPTPAGVTNDVVAGPDGGYWFTEIIGNKIGRISPRAPYDVVEFPLPVGSSQPDSIVVGPDGALWFSEWRDKIGRISPRPPYTIEEFAVPTRGALLHKLVRGDDKTIWFTEASADKIGRLTVARDGRPTITEFPVPTGNAFPTGLTVGERGALWFTEVRAGQIGRFDPRSPSRITEFPLPSRTSAPLDIISERDGDLSFTELGGNAIGRLHPGHGSQPSFTECRVPNTPYFLAQGPDGAIWFTEFHDPGIKIGRLVA